VSSLIVEVCKVDNIIKHPNADKLSIVQVKGWNCIVGLDQYSIGDLVVFVPPDCILTDSLIGKYKLDYLKKNGRTGSVKLRGYVSQGLILDLPDGKWNVGDDVSVILGITKWEPPQASYQVSVAKTSKKRINPFFDKYTDIENIKHYPDVFADGDIVVITEKLHGCNSRYGYLEIGITPNVSVMEKISSWIRKNVLRQKYEFVYGSHNVQITSHSNRKSFYGLDVWAEMIVKYNLNKVIPEKTIIYGELYGDKIQDLTYGLKDGKRDFAVFDIKQNSAYLDWADVIRICNEIGLRHVPQLYIGEYRDGILDKYTSGSSILYGNQIREGCVIKSACKENDLRIGRKILKSISPDYLTRKDGTEFK
jgi:RNA ligase (TIGR02306 family)